RLNKIGPSILGSMPRVPETKALTGLAVDIREANTIRANYVEGSLAIPSGKGLTNWAGWMLNYDEPIILVADSQEQADSAARDMATIGLDVVSGWIHPSSLEKSRFST